MADTLHPQELLQSVLRCGNPIALKPKLKKRDREQITQALIEGLSSSAYQEQCAALLKNKILKQSQVAGRLCFFGITDPAKRSISIQILISLGPEAIGSAIGSLNSLDADVIGAAKEILIGIGRPSIQPLVKILADRQKMPIIAEILIALANKHMETVCHTLLKFLKIKELRMPIYLILGAIGEQSLPSLYKWKDTDGFDRSNFIAVAEKFIRDDRKVPQHYIPKFSPGSVSADRMSEIPPLSISNGASFRPKKESIKADTKYEPKSRLEIGPNSPTWPGSNAIRFSPDSRVPAPGLYDKNVINKMPRWRPSISR